MYLPLQKAGAGSLALVQSSPGAAASEIKTSDTINRRCPGLEAQAVAAAALASEATRLL